MKPHLSDRLRENVAYFTDDKWGGYWQTVRDGKPYNFRLQPHPADEIDRLTAELAEARAEIKKQMRRATDAEYMGRAYRNMLGPTGTVVAKMWDDKRVNRVHFDWGPEARKLTGEERAQFILDFENAPRREALPDEIDGGTFFLASKGE